MLAVLITPHGSDMLAACLFSIRYYSMLSTGSLVRSAAYSLPQRATAKMFCKQPGCKCPACCCVRCGLRCFVLPLVVAAVTGVHSKEVVYFPGHQGLSGQHMFVACQLLHAYLSARQ
jgi:hypothetical protein